MQGQPIRCPLIVIPGISPIRAALSSSPALRELGIAHRYPINKIIYDDGNHAIPQPTRDSDPPAHDAFLSHIKRQTKCLPNEATGDISIKRSDDAGIIRIPIDQDHSLILAIRTESPHEIISAMLGYKDRSTEPSDITDDVVSKKFPTSISSAYYSTKKMLRARADDAYSALESPVKSFSKTSKACSIGKHERRGGHVESVTGKPAQV